MRSLHVDRFNHDEDAPDYDLDVRNEADPIRAGYAELLQWVARRLGEADDRDLLELGSGTGNLSHLLLPCRSLSCVDVSLAMTEVARAKLPKDAPVTWHQDDLLSFFDVPRGPFHAVVSTYTVHHLTGEEKAMLFAEIRDALRPGGRAIFGDLMFESEREREKQLARWRAQGEEELVETVEDELFWNLDQEEDALRRVGFAVARQRFSLLSWGLDCRL